MINFKSSVISNTLDGQKTDFKINKLKRNQPDDERSDDNDDEDDEDYEIKSKKDRA